MSAGYITLCGKDALQLMIARQMQAHISRPLLVLLTLALLFMVAACALLFVLALFGLEANAQLLASVLLGVNAFLVFSLVLMWRALVARIRWGRKPVLSFESAGLSFTTDYRNVLHVAYANITEVGFDARYRVAPLTLRCADSSTVQLSLNTADVSGVQVFNELKSRLPHLMQPYSTVRRLVSLPQSGDAGAVAA